MEKWDIRIAYSATAWLLQRLSYPFCRWYLFRVKKWRIKTDPQLGEIRKPLLIAAAPHLAHLDVVAVPAAVPASLLPVRWLADRKIFTNPLKSVWLKLWGAIPVDRDPQGGFECQDIDPILEFVLLDKCVGVFPECCLVGGRFNHKHKDLIASALEWNICVLPVALSDDRITESNLRNNLAANKKQILIGTPLLTTADLLDSLAS